jgi:hypothetical protein
MAPTNNGPIEHRDESGFHAALRADLLDVIDEVVLLSPFLHGGRACQYYALLGDLVRRGVRVTIYTKPERELAGGSREEHARVCGSLRAVGVDLKTRPSMHEKVAALDRRILWHGSLNILSHGSSTESMLRIASPELVASMLADLGLLEGPQVPEQQPALAADAGPDCACPRCGSATVIRGGPFTRVSCPAADCGFEFDPRLSRWLLSAQARRRTS